MSDDDWMKLNLVLVAVGFALAGLTLYLANT